MTSTERGALWSIRTSTFAGLVPGASHYVVRLHGRTEDVEVLYRMDVDDARALSSWDFTERPGTLTGRFRTRPAALAGAIAAWRSLAGERDVLIDEFDMGMVHAGPDDLVDEGRSYAHDERAWFTFMDSFQQRVYPTVFGRGAPPSPRRDVEVVLGHDGDGWKVEEVR